MASLVAAAIIGAVAIRAAGHTFFVLQSGFTQELFGATSHLLPANAVLGGVATLPDGDVISAECAQGTSPTRLHRFEHAVTVPKNGSNVHQEIVVPVVPALPGCGIAYHPNGLLYLNTDNGTSGVAEINPSTGVVLRLLGVRGNKLGIAVDPVSSHLVYPARDCLPTVGPTCTLIDLDAITGSVATRASFNSTEVGYVDGVSFDPTGGFIFLANRFPVRRVTILTSAGALVQHVPLSSEPVGLAFHDSPRFVVTNNTGVGEASATMTRLDFPAGNYEAPPSVSMFASDGFRGDLMQVGTDGCLYVTQAGTRYDDFTETTENSLVQICGGFAPPPGIIVVPPVTTGTLQGVITNKSNGSVIAGATVHLSNGAEVMTNASGQYSFTIAGGTYSASAAATGFITGMASGIAVVNGQTTTLNFALMPTPPPVDPCTAANTFFGLGAAASFTVLGTGCGTSVDISGKNTLIVGDVGAGPQTDLWLQSGTIQGNVIADPTAWVGKKNIVIQGSTTKKSLSSAATAVTAASARLAKLKPTQKLPAVTRSITIVGKGGVNVVSIPFVDLTCATITIKGTASDIFVFNVPGGFALDASHIHLTGGVQPCNIVWNFTSASSCPEDVTVGDGSEVVGTILAPSRYVDVEDSSLVGRILVGTDATVFAAGIKPR